MLKAQDRKNGQKGFTLIEIIAVLVILGVLAAVAIPKYVDMQTAARQAAVDGALAAAGSNASIRYANLVLTAGAAVTAATLKTALDACCTAVGDFTVTYATAANATTGGIDVTVTVTATTNPNITIANVARTTKTFTI
jgi:MSHA pilin protein MshA